MRIVAIAALVSLTLSAVAHAGPPHHQRDRWDDDVEVDRSRMLRKLERVEFLLNAVAAEKNTKKRQNLAREAREELSELQREVRRAPRDRDSDRVVHAPPPPPARPVMAPPPPPRPQVYPIAQPQLSQLLQALHREPFAKNKLQVLGSAAPAHFFMVSQVQEVLSRFVHSKDRLAAAEMLKPRILDMENAFQLYASFDFASDKAKLKDILSR